MRTQIVPIESVMVAERLRKTNAATVDYIANSFEVVGQLQPVIVQREAGRLVLLAGAHRLEAAKKVGWHDIEVKEIDLSRYSKRMAEIIVQIVEVDENLGRADLDQSERVLFMGKRFDLTEQKMRVEREETAERELAAAKRAKEAANAALKAAKEEEEKAAAKKARDAAKVSLDTAARRVETLAVSSSPAGEQSTATAKNAARGVAEEVAKELKMKRSTVHNLNSFRNRVGDEVLKLFAGTKLGTKAELEAFVTLKQRFPDRADWLIKMNTRLKAEGKGLYSAAREVGLQQKDANAMTKTKAMETPDGARENFKKVAQEMKLMADKLRAAMNSLPREERSQHPEPMKIVELASHLVQRTAKRPVQKRTGTEHRYGGQNEGPSRVDAAKELDAHAAEIAAVLKKKAKKDKAAKKSASECVSKKPA